jgi:hypothetical protein
MDTEQELREGCVLAVALCDLILSQDLWPDIDAESLQEFRASVESTRAYCLDAIHEHDHQSE